ncbi:DNA mismatch repair mutL domain protein [Orientia tsutsugamushi str. UT76]|nr:DNA mismatch repair mutL domain protein [Orientia tsutsugamushi str. UT76]
MCYDVVKRLAISYPHIAFSLVHDDKTILKLKASSQLSLMMLENLEYLKYYQKIY